MKIRPYRPADCGALMQLFYHTVHAVCTRDYTPAQLDAWAPKDMDRAHWDAKFRDGTTLVAAGDDGSILGFGTVREDGYLNLLYVHQDHQGKSVGNILCDFLEGLYPAERMSVHASETAKPFFEARGYRLVRKQQAERRGQSLTNYLMEKELI